MSTNEFSQLTIDITKQLSKTVKKEQGIFITPKTIIRKLHDSIIKFVNLNESPCVDVLEPSCATCEMVSYLDGLYSNLFIDAIEMNTTIYDKIRNHFSFKNTVKLIQGDFIKYDPNGKLYDLIIGNPPYLVIEKSAVPESYSEYIVGRPNLFGLFLLHSISMLKQNGILAFIIPKSFLNAAYYANIRHYLKSSGTILEIIDFEKDGGFIDTQQSTFGFIFKKTGHIDIPSECKYSIQFADNFMFADNANALRELLSGSTTLAKLGLTVKTGTVVWNQQKPILTSDSSKTLLLYNSNISKNNTIELLEFSNDEKKQYIQMVGSNSPAIVVNRGNGNSAYKLNYAFVDGTTTYLAENHLNVISSKLTGIERIELFQKILASFKNPKTEQFIKTFLGNNGLSKTELETVFPIYL